MKNHSPAGILCLLAASACLHATPVSIGDPSFESNPSASGGNLAVGTYSNSIGPEWTGAGGQNSGNAFEERIAGFASEGTDHLGMVQDYDVWQNLSVTYLANTRYTLTVGVGNRPGITAGNNESRFMLANSVGTIYATGSVNASTIPAGTFADQTVVFDTTNIPASVGKTIRILFRARGTNRSHFDNIRLDASPITLTPPTLVNLNAISVTGNSATLRGQITEAGSNVPTVTIYHGPADGGTNPANWANNIILGTQSGIFTAPASGIPVNTTWYYRAMATNTAGTAWAPATATFTTTSGTVPASVVINEFQEKPEDEHELEEFIELHNPGDTDINIGGWSLSNAVTFAIPAGTIIPAHGYKVIAMNPAAILTRYGVTALGPWSGKLSSGGETIEVKNGAGVVQDSVPYVPGFPWPSAIDGEGPSAELINPGLNNSLGGSWRASNGLPTPGAPNSTYVPIELAPPHIQNVAHSPAQPSTNQAVTVTAKITDPDGVGPVSLEYQLVEPGSYIHVSDPLYTTSWTSVPMVDNGNLGDATAGDSVYTAILPGNLQTHRRLVRYRIVFQDGVGNSQRVPYADDLQSNFAYFTYDTMPAWKGSLKPGSAPVQTYSAAALSAIPVYTLIANGTDVINTQYVSGYDEDRFRGTLVYNGVVYDNIEFRNRGQGSTYQSGKNKWRFYFNPARDFHAKDHFGNDYSESWGSFSVNACAAPWAPVHRGSAGVEEASSLKLFGLAGVPSPSSHYFHLRVVRGANETPEAGTQVNDPIGSGNTDGQYAGDFWGIYLAIERFKGNFIDERGMEDGNIYKIEGGNGEPENLLPGVAPNSADWNAFRSVVEGATVPTEQWWRDNMDMPNYYTFHAINRLVGNIDLRAGENHFFYHRPSDNRWVVMPWDLDMMYIPKSHQGSSISGFGTKPGVIMAHRSILQNPGLMLEFRNRGREVLDLLGSDATPNGGQMGQLLDEYAQIVAPTGTTDNFANADAAMWNYHPRTRGTDGAHNGQSNHKGNFFYTPYNDDRIGGSWVRTFPGVTPNTAGTHANLMSYFLNYVTNAWPGGTWTANNGQPLGYGYQYLLSESADTDIPTKPTLTYTGAAGYPRNNLSFSATAFADPQGAGTYTATQWRLAEISAPGIPGYVVNSPRKYEIQDGWTVTTTGTTITLPSTVAATGKTYRARVRYQDNTGRWSNWSNPIQFGSGAAVETLVHYWNFNGDSLTPNYTIGGGTITTQGAAPVEFIYGDGQAFAAANARNGDVAGRHLRVNNPVGASLTFALPTNGYNNLVGAVEVRRSSVASAAELETWSYSTDNGANYTLLKTITISADAPVVVDLDLRSIPAANNNPDFRLKVEILKGAGGTAGNHRFDNFTLTGNPIPGTYAAWLKTAFTESEQKNSALSGMNGDPDKDGRSNFLEFALATSPKTGDASDVKFTWSTVGETRYPALRFKRPQGVVGVTYEVFASDTVEGWVGVSSTIVESTPLGNGVEEVVIRDTQEATPEKRFLRLKVKSNP